MIFMVCIYLTYMYMKWYLYVWFGYGSTLLGGDSYLVWICMVWKYKLEMGQHGFVGDLDMAETLIFVEKERESKGWYFTKCVIQPTRVFVKSEGGTMDPQNAGSFFWVLVILTLPTSQGTC